MRRSTCDPAASVKAIVVLRNGAEASEVDLVEHCAGRIAGYKKPRSVEFRAALPRLPHGKVDKKGLREPYWRGASRGVA